MTARVDALTVDQGPPARIHAETWILAIVIPFMLLGTVAMVRQVVEAGRHAGWFEPVSVGGLAPAAARASPDTGRPRAARVRWRGGG